MSPAISAPARSEWRRRRNIAGDHGIAPPSLALASTSVIKKWADNANRSVRPGSMRSFR